MNKTFKKFIIALLIASIFVFPTAMVNDRVQAQDFYPPTLEPSLSADGQTLYNAVAPLIITVDSNPAMQGIKIPDLKGDGTLADPDAATSTFSITFVTAGGTDPWSQVCSAFPAEAQTAFYAAAAIWANRLQSTVPITIQACWANLGSSSTLGYSGGQPLHRNFSGAPQANTWYQGSLANSLNGSDLSTTNFDMYITYNSGFSWYYGTDGNPPALTYDLVTVAAHEIGHGLNFSGTASYAGGTGSYGYLGDPNIYDRFVEDNGGTKITSYTNPSAALGALYTSGSLWFNGTNANAANSGSRVKLYAPNTWSSGSSYSHLDEVFNGTANDMMTFSVASGSSNHTPGPVIMGLLKDLGWVLAGTTPPVTSKIYLPLVLKNSGTSAASGPTAGFWQNTAGNTYFYVTSGGTTVRQFTILVDLPGCGTYWIYRTIPNGDATISSNQFSFSGTYYASGTFTSNIAAQGITGLSSYGPVCGYYWNGGPWPWSANWINGTQPSAMPAHAVGTVGFELLETMLPIEGAYIAIPAK